MAQQKFPILFYGKVVGTGTVEDDGAVTGTITAAIDINDEGMQKILRADLLNHLSVELDPAVPKEVHPGQGSFPWGSSDTP